MIQRTKVEQELNKKRNLETKYSLKEQKNFNGSYDLLLRMQHYERCYREGKPLISDEEWDELVKQTGYEESFDEIVSPDGRKWVKFGSPLPSLKKISSFDMLDRFLQDGKSYIVEPKLDGLTFNAVYLKDNTDDVFYLHQITSRGDGLNGLQLKDDALSCVEKIGLPDKLINLPESVVIGNKFELRGEAVINKEDYPKNVIARSVVAGIFNRNNPVSLEYLINNFSEELAIKQGIIGKRNIYKHAKIENGKIMRLHSKTGEWEEYQTEIVHERVYFVSFAITMKNGNIDNPEILEKIDGILPISKLYSHDPKFEDLFCITDNRAQIKKIVDRVYGCINGIRDISLERIKNTTKFAIDGVVIKPVDSDITTQQMKPKIKYNKVIVPHHPIDQVAIKLQGDSVESVIEKIIYRTTKLGNTTCSGQIRPVTMETGAIVSNINLNNPEWLKLPENKWIKEGAPCKVYLINDVRPNIGPI